MDNFMNAIAVIAELIVVTWTLITIIKTDGLNHRKDSDVEFP